MAEPKVVAVDLARVYTQPTKGTLRATLAWGDPVEVDAIDASTVQIRFTRHVRKADGTFEPVTDPGFLRAPAGVDPATIVAAPESVRILKADFVDVQQGDGAVLEAPDGKVVLIDGGDNQLFARYLAGRFRGTSLDSPKDVEAIVVTHGDADHFLGLTEIGASETNTSPFKRLFLRPARVFHNGLVKRGTKRPDGKTRKETELLGATTKVGDKVVITGLEEDLLAVPDSEMNQPFQRWKAALASWNARSPIAFRRLSIGDDAAFDFLRDSGVDVRVLGPIPFDDGTVKGLEFLGEPRRGPRIGDGALGLDDAAFGAPSSSHTINGQSVVLHVKFGRFRFLMAGDLNDQAERHLTTKLPGRLRAEVLKVPHHGSAEFSAAFLKAVKPCVSVVSSGDESARKEFIHPRATLVGALGRYSRLNEPLIFVTELVAFFAVRGLSVTQEDLTKHPTVAGGGPIPPGVKPFFGFERTAFGLVRVRTDGERLFVYTNSGQTDLKEAYALKASAGGAVDFDPVRMV